MRSKYLIWWLIPIFILGGIIIDGANTNKETMFPASILFIPFELVFLPILGGIYFSLRNASKATPFVRLVDVLVWYTFFCPIAIFTYSIVPLATNYNHSSLRLAYILEVLVFSGIFLFLVVQIIAIVLLIYIKIKRKIPTSL